MSDGPFFGDPQDPILYMLLSFAIVDLPFAVALDTLFLPYDVYKNRTKKPERDCGLLMDSEQESKVEQKDEEPE